MDRELDIATKNDNTITTPKIKNGLTFITFYQYYHYLNTLSIFWICSDTTLSILLTNQLKI
jgi:hypothetical protein